MQAPRHHNAELTHAVSSILICPCTISDQWSELLDQLCGAQSKANDWPGKKERDRGRVGGAL